MHLLREDATSAYDHYEEMLNERQDGSQIDAGRTGLARELARMNLPLSYYTQWYWKIDLHNLFHFLAVRADSHAQYEIRVYAELMLDLVAKWVPLAHAAFMDYRVGGAEISAKGLSVIRRMLAGENVSEAESQMSAREWRELMDTLGRG